MTLIEKNNIENLNFDDLTIKELFDHLIKYLDEFTIADNMLIAYPVNSNTKIKDSSVLDYKIKDNFINLFNLTQNLISKNLSEYIKYPIADLVSFLNILFNFNKLVAKKNLLILNFYIENVLHKILNSFYHFYFTYKNDIEKITNLDNNLFFPRLFSTLPLNVLYKDLKLIDLITFFDFITNFQTSSKLVFEINSVIDLILFGQLVLSEEERKKYNTWLCVTNQKNKQYINDIHYSSYYSSEILKNIADIIKEKNKIIDPNITSNLNYYASDKEIVNGDKRLNLTNLPSDISNIFISLFKFIKINLNTYPNILKNITDKIEYFNLAKKMQFYYIPEVDAISILFDFKNEIDIKDYQIEIMNVILENTFFKTFSFCIDNPNLLYIFLQKEDYANIQKIDFTLYKHLKDIIFSNLVNRNNEIKNLKEGIHLLNKNKADIIKDKDKIIDAKELVKDNKNYIINYYADNKIIINNDLKLDISNILSYSELTDFINLKESKIFDFIQNLNNELKHYAFIKDLSFHYIPKVKTISITFDLMRKDTENFTEYKKVVILKNMPFKNRSFSNDGAPILYLFLQEEDFNFLKKEDLSFYSFLINKNNEIKNLKEITSSKKENDLSLPIDSNFLKKQNDLLVDAISNTFADFSFIKNLELIYKDVLCTNLCILVTYNLNEFEDYLKAQKKFISKNEIDKFIRDIINHNINLYPKTNLIISYNYKETTEEIIPVIEEQKPLNKKKVNSVIPSIKFIPQVDSFDFDKVNEHFNNSILNMHKNQLVSLFDKNLNKCKYISYYRFYFKNKDTIKLLIYLKENNAKHAEKIRDIIDHNKIEFGSYLTIKCSINKPYIKK